MKNKTIILCLLIALIFLFGCATKKPVETVTKITADKTIDEAQSKEEQALPPSSQKVESLEIMDIKTLECEKINPNDFNEGIFTIKAQINNLVKYDEVIGCPIYLGDAGIKEGLSADDFVLAKNRGGIQPDGSIILNVSVPLNYMYDHEVKICCDDFCISKKIIYQCPDTALWGK